jgi:hypothetical protein
MHLRFFLPWNCEASAPQQFIRKPKPKSIKCTIKLKGEGRRERETYQYTKLGERTNPFSKTT